MPPENFEIFGALRCILEAPEHSLYYYIPAAEQFYAFCHYYKIYPQYLQVIVSLLYKSFSIVNRARLVRRSSDIVECKYVLTLFMDEKVLSQPALLTESVRAICSNFRRYIQRQ